MAIEGGCYCKQVRYEITGEIGMKPQCFCRECQYTTGGDSMFGMGVGEDGFRVTQGEAKEFSRSDLENPVTRMFCPNCGSHIASQPMPGMIIVKVGTLDDPSIYGGPQMAIFTCDAQPHHSVPTDIPTFDKVPG